jgi:hypothetical protein
VKTRRNLRQKPARAGTSETNVNSLRRIKMLVMSEAIVSRDIDILSKAIACLSETLS